MQSVLDQKLPEGKYSDGSLANFSHSGCIHNHQSCYVLLSATGNSNHRELFCVRALYLLTVADLSHFAQAKEAIGMRGVHI